MQNISEVRKRRFQTILQMRALGRRHNINLYQEHTLLHS